MAKKFKNPSGRKNIIRQLLLSDDPSDLFSGVAIELTKEERGLILEERYFNKLKELALKYGDLRALEAIKLDRNGITDPSLLSERVRSELSEKLQEEYLELARKNAEEALRSGWHTGIADTNKALESDGRAAVKTAPRELKSYAIDSQPGKIILEDVEKWRLRPEVVRVLSNREGYSGNIYSVFFGGGVSKDDERFFTSLRDSLERGLSEKEATKRAMEAIKETPTTFEVIRNVVRTETQRAMQAGIVDSTKTTGLIPAYLFDSVNDDRETPFCRSRHGLLILSDDNELLQQCTPPLHYQCRSSLIPLTRRAFESRGGLKQAQKDRIKLLNAPIFKW